MYDQQKTKELNDHFRTTLIGGRLLLTHGIAARPDALEIVARISQFDAFDDNNDPHNEHDFGSIEVGPDKVFWKLDYYSRNLEEGSPDPADPAVTTRVLTVMLSSEY